MMGVFVGGELPLTDQGYVMWQKGNITIFFGPDLSFDFIMTHVHVVFTLLEMNKLSTSLEISHFPLVA